MKACGHVQWEFSFDVLAMILKCLNFEESIKCDKSINILLRATRQYQLEVSTFNFPQQKDFHNFHKSLNFPTLALAAFKHFSSLS